MLKLTQILKLRRKFPRKLLIRQLPNIWKLTHIPRKFRIQFTAFIEFQASKKRKKYPPTFQMFCSYAKRTQYKLLETLFWVFYLHRRACQCILGLTLFTILKFSYTENLNLICLQFYHKVPALGLCSNINDRKPQKAVVWARGSSAWGLQSRDTSPLTACPLSTHYTALN